MQLFHAKKTSRRSRLIPIFVFANVTFLRGLAINVESYSLARQRHCVQIQTAYLSRWMTITCRCFKPNHRELLASKRS
jgi:hypothetical protein